MAGLVSPSPADGRTDMLFSTRQGFLDNLKSIAGYIVQAATNTHAPSSMTFAIYGKWGAGKSSALRVLEDLIKNEAAQGQSATPDQSLTISFTYFDSPLWERFPDVRPALAYEIVRGISPKALSEIAALLGAMTGRNPAVLPADADLKRAVLFFDVLSSIPSAPVLEQWMRDTAVRFSGATGGTSHAHVVMIDDADRCSFSFTARLLAAMNYWQTTPGFSIFFIIAADHDYLLDSLRENLPHGARNPVQALEKYVHLSVNMPGFLEDIEDVGSFLEKLTDAVLDDGSMDQARREELKAIIEESVRTYPSCVFAPLLELDESSLTPRAVKHRFNTFMAEFKPQTGLDKLPVTDLKDWIIKAFWPEFWWQFIWKLKVMPRDRDTRDWDQKADWVDGLTSLGKDLLDVRRRDRPGEDSTSALRSLAASKGVDLREIDPLLVMYLAVAPEWQRPPAGPPGTKSSLRDTGVGISRQSDEPLIPQDEDDGAGEPASVPATPDDRVFYYRLVAEQAHDAGDDTLARGYLVGIAEVVKEGSLQRRSAATVGNAALLAERMHDPELALELHQAANNVDPHHWNVAQNFVEFIIDEHLTGLYAHARDMLAQLQTQGARHKPERTSMLLLRFADVAGERPSPEMVQSSVDRFIRELSQDPTLTQLVRLFSLGQDNLSVDQASRACQIVCEAPSADDTVKYRTLRILGDFLAPSDEDKVEGLASDIYRYLLGTGLACFAESDANDVKHNLATLLSNRGFANAAALLWEEVYTTRPGDQTVRRAFAIQLDRIDREADAAKVLMGQELPALSLTAETVPYPLVTDADRWWERLTVEPHRPCFSSVPSVVPSIG